MKSKAPLLVLLVVVAILLFAASRMLPPAPTASRDAPDRADAELAGTPLPPLEGADAWIHGGPLTPDSLRGHPTVVVMWSDTDPECLRELPVVQSWHQAYARYSIRVVGVHEPDFAFAADSTVAAAVVDRLGLAFPIALDSGYRLRGRLGAPLDGPRIVVADAEGRIVLATLGRDHLALVEQAVREQVRRLHPEIAFPGAREGEPAGAPRAGSVPRVIYLGTDRAPEGPLEGATPGEARNFTAQFRYQVEGKPYVPYPVGAWTPNSEGLIARRGGAENFLALRYDAGSLWVVVSPPAGSSGRLWVLRDERWMTQDDLGADARLDGRGASYVEVGEPRLYEICRAGRGRHIVKLSPESPGLTLHALIVEPGAASGAGPD